MTDLSADVERALVEALDGGALDAIPWWLANGAELNNAGKLLAQALKERDEARAALSSDDRVVFIDEDGDTVEVRANNEESYRWRFSRHAAWSEWMWDNVNAMPLEHKPVADRIRKLCEAHKT